MSWGVKGDSHSANQVLQNIVIYNSDHLPLRAIVDIVTLLYIAIYIRYEEEGFPKIEWVK